MGWAFTVAGVLLMAYGQFRQARQQGVWQWKLFLGLLGASALFLGVVVVPLGRSNLPDTHPNLLLALILGGVLVFVTAVVAVARKVSQDWVVKER